METMTRPQVNMERLHNLAMWNMEDHDDDVLNLTFGSTSVEFKYRTLDHRVVSHYRHGYCGFLGLAIHEATDLPLAVFTIPGCEGEDWLGHVAVKVGEDAYLDAGGIVTEAQIQKIYGYGADTEFGAMRLQIAEDLDDVPEIFHAEVINQPWAFLEELEELVTRDYAEQLIEKHL